jgi:ABC-type glycerol-3-phosphate transport system substrate-binding protein
MRNGKRGRWLVSCFLLAGMMTVGCANGEWNTGQKEANDSEGSKTNSSLTDTNVTGTSKGNTGTSDADGYVYVPEFLSLSDGVEGYSTGFRLANDFLYYVTYGEEGVRLISRPLTMDTESTDTELSDTESTDTELSEIPLDLSSSSYATQMILDQEGNFHILTQSYSQEGSSSYGQGESSSRYQVETYDPKGKKLSVWDVSEQVNADPSDIYVQSLAMDEKDNLYLCGSHCVWLYDEEGAYYGQINAPGTILSMGTGKDGKVYIAYVEKSSKWLAELDFTSRTIGRTYDNFPGNGSGTLSLGEDGDFYLNGESGLIAYDLSDQSGTQILNWVDSSISGESIRQVGKLSDGRFAAVSMVMGESQTAIELVTLTKTPISDLPDKEEIVVASLSDSYFLKEQAAAFNGKSDTYKIIVKSYLGQMNSIGEADFADAVNRMNIEIASNHAPDLLLISTNAIDWETYGDKEVFADLTPFFEKSETLKKEDIVDSIVRTFTYEDKLIGLPFTFSIQTMVGKTSVLGDKAGWTIEDLKRFMDKYPISQVLPTMTKDTFLYSCLSYSMDTYMDWEQGISYFDQDDFKEILELANRFPAEIDINQLLYADSTGALGTDEILLQTATPFSVNSYLAILAQAQAPLNFIGFPTADGHRGNGITIPDGVYAILAKSKHQEGAWAFLESVLSEKKENWQLFPVLKSELDEMCKEAAEPNYLLDDKGEPVIGADGEKVQVRKSSIRYADGPTIDIYAATREEIDDLYELIDSAGKTAGRSNDIMLIIREEAKGYFDGQKSLDETVEIIQNRVSLYVSENQ